MFEVTAWPLWGGCALALIVGWLGYRFGRSRGVTEADSRWTTWTGLTAEELRDRVFDEQLRALRRQIGRPADGWPD